MKSEKSKDLMLVICLKGKIEAPRDYRNPKGPQTGQAQERMVSTLEQMQVPNGTGPGVRRTRCPEE